MADEESEDRKLPARNDEDPQSPEIDGLAWPSDETFFGIDGDNGLIIDGLLSPPQGSASFPSAASREQGRQHQTPSVPNAPSDNSLKVGQPNEPNADWQQPSHHLVERQGVLMKIIFSSNRAPNVSDRQYLELAISAEVALYRSATSLDEYILNGSNYRENRSMPQEQSNQASSSNIHPLVALTADCLNKNDVEMEVKTADRTHPYREMIRKKWKEYDAAERRSDEKRNIAKFVVDYVRSRDPPGRFLKRMRVGTFYVFLDVGDKKAIFKASHALCDAKKYKCNAIETNHQSPRLQPHPPAQQLAGETTQARVCLQPHPTTQQQGRRTVQARVNLGEVNYYFLRNLARNTTFLPLYTVPHLEESADVQWLLAMNVPYTEIYISLPTLAPTSLLVPNFELRQFLNEVFRLLETRSPVPSHLGPSGDQSHTLPYQPLLGQAIGGSHSHAAPAVSQSHPYPSVALRIQSSQLEIGALTRIPNYVVGQQVAGRLNAANNNQNLAQPLQRRPSIANILAYTRLTHNRTSQEIEVDHRHHGSTAATRGTVTSTSSVAVAAREAARITPDQSSDDHTVSANKKARLR